VCEEHHVQEDLLEQLEVDMEIIPGKAVRVGAVESDPRAGGIYGLSSSLSGLIYTITPLLSCILMCAETLDFCFIAMI